MRLFTVIEASYGCVINQSTGSDMCPIWINISCVYQIVLHVIYKMCYMDFESLMDFE